MHLSKPISSIILAVWGSLLSIPTLSGVPPSSTGFLTWYSSIDSSGLGLPYIQLGNFTHSRGFYPPFLAPITEEGRNGLFRFIPRAYFLKNNHSQYKRIVDIDSARQWVTILEKSFGVDVRLPSILPFEEYLQIRLQEETQRLLRETLSKSPSARERDQQKGRGLGFDIPIPIKSRTFQTVFGSANVRLSVVGNVTIDGGLRHEKRSQVRTTYARASDYNFKMKQTQRFTVKGDIGTKVHVYVDQDSERPFEFENAVRLEYKGLEDEIIQSIEACNVSLSLPATRFVSYSCKNTWLFGIKALMKMGNLKITAIASQEKGKQQKMTIRGGATENEYKIPDYQYRRGTYFFLNHVYRRNFKRFDAEGNHLFNPDSVITQIELYKSDYRYENKPGSIRGWAIADPRGADPANPDTSTFDQEHYRGYFLRVDPTDYFVDKELGYIALERPLQEGEVLAVAYRDTSGNEVGDIHFVDDGHSTIILQLLRPRTPLPSDYTWDLEWKNVYYLGTTNINREGFELKIFYKPAASEEPQETQEVDGQQVSYLQIFGLDQKDQNGNPNPDNLLDNDPNIINWARGELIFPDLRPFDPEGYYVNGQLVRSKLDPQKREPAIYDTTDFQYISRQSRFYIAVKAKIRQPNYNLGFNVIEGSEEIILNGRKLQRGRDYIIDYFSGTLTILHEQATDPNASLEITYESNELFQIERKTLMGLRWDYELFNDSFIGGAFLYMNQSSLERKIRIGGGGPMRNFIWDVNAALRFEPNFLTKALDALPFVQTNQPSSFNFEGEIAQIIPNPNTQNNPSTGDHNGVAYIDDFEGGTAKRENPLGIMRRIWTMSSVPVEIDGFPEYNALPNDLLKNKSRGRLIWYNPVERRRIKEIWPKREVNPNVPQLVDVLALEFEPNEYGENSWGGIMRALPPGLFDQSRSKYLEVWVKGDQGRLHIDLGQISEDVIPNRRLDTEDKRRGGIRNGILDDDEDVGLDGMANDDPRAIQAGGDFWDVNGNGIKDPDEPYSNDDWSYRDLSNVYSQINGTEGNARDEGGRYPDTEDINQNGDVDLQNDYFEFSFSLDKTSPDTTYIAGGQTNPYGWRLYRIPLNDPTKVVGNPQWTLIQFVRIWVDGFQQKGALEIAEIKLVGSDWRELGVALSDTSEYDAKNDSTVTVTVVNTHDNPDYEPPPGVSGVVDPITRVRAKEQALVLQINQLPPGANGIVQQSMFRDMDFIYYNKIKMFVYGKDPLGTHIRHDSSLVEFFFRFGADDHNYYEIREKVYPGWDKRNEIDIDLLDLTSLKLDSSRVDAYGNLYREVNGKILRIVGRPSIRNIRQMTFGVKNLSDYIPFTGQIWLNELRLSDVKKDKGWAMRARMDLKLADIGSINAEINRQDADFHNIQTRFGTGSNRLGGNLNGRFELGRLLPRSWNLSIPLSIGYTASQSTPKYYPGSDIEVRPGSIPDSLLQVIRTRNRRQSWSLSIKRSAHSKNPFLRYTLDQMSLSLSQSITELSDSRTKMKQDKAFTGDLSYNLNLAARPFFKPFGWLGNGPIIRKLSQMKFYYTPSRISYRLSANRSGTISELRNGLTTDRYNFVIRQSFSTSFRPLESVSLDFSRDRTNDLRNIRDPWKVSPKNFGDLTSISQQISGKYDPKIFRWLTTSFSFSSNFRWNNNIQQRRTGQSASSNNTWSASLTFTPKSLLGSFKKGPSRRSYQPPRRQLPRRREPKEAKKSEEKKKKKKSKQPSGLPLGKLLKELVLKMQPITIQISQKSNTNNYGLKGMPSLAYQLGRTFDPGVETVQNVGTNRSSISRSLNISAQTGFSPTARVTINLRFNYANSMSKTTLATGTITHTVVALGKKELPLPEWTVRWSGLERLSLFKKIATQVNLDHAYSGRKVKKWNERRDRIASEDVNANFRPLIGLNIVFKKGINLRAQYNSSISITNNLLGGQGGTRRKNNSFNLTVNYSKSGGFRLPIPLLKDKVIKNNVDFSLTFTRTKDVSEQKRGQQGEYVEWTRVEKWSLAPRITYSFSTNVRGGIYFELGKTKNKLMGETSIKEFGINVNISISGR